MFWSASLCLLVAWLLALLLNLGAMWMNLFPLALVTLLLYRLVGTALRR